MGLSDRKTPKQPTLWIAVERMGTFAETVADLRLPGPPDGCESQQLFDWAAITFSMCRGDLAMAFKVHLAVTYAERWGLPIARIPTGEFVIKAKTGWDGEE